MNIENLKHALSNKLCTVIVHADYEESQLHGGTLGDVRLLTGTAEAATGEKLPYSIVVKTQKRWERHGDNNSWRREYDLYKSELSRYFTVSFRWPVCYHAVMEDDEIQLWMEYIDGVTGLSLTGDMYERAAYEIGRFQGRLYTEQIKPDLCNMSGIDYAKNFYLHYRSWNVVYDYIRSDTCGIPKHLRGMLVAFDESFDEIWRRIEKLPVVLCHRDYWVTNIFSKDGNIVAIDWDTTGWGHFGEDIASLIADEADVEHMAKYYHSCAHSYVKGFTEYVDISLDHCIREQMLMLFGYRIVEWFINAKTQDEKKLQVDTLQQIFDMA